MRILPNGCAVTGKSHHVEWCEASGLQHDKWMSEQICAHIKPGDTVINVGAHIGTLCAGMLEAGAHVVAFKPNPVRYSGQTNLGVAKRKRGDIRRPSQRGK